MTSDSELLRRFAKTNSEDAFAELVKRHVNLVYSAALRQVGGDTHLAQDVAQTVFADLARKAASLSRREGLTGWLYTSAHFAAAKIARTENRRRDREKKFMREPTHETAPDASRAEAFAEAGADWEKLRPMLDQVMHELKETDREAILLRYFENRPFAEVGAKLGLNENAARMRVERALEKLRTIFAKRGITTATALASVISVNAVQVAPVGLVTTLTTASIATAGTGAFTLLKMMTATQLKLGVTALVMAGATTVLVFQHQAQTKLRVENEMLTQQIAQLQANNGSLSNRLTEIGEAKSLTDGQMNELLKLRGEVGLLRQKTNELGKVRESVQEVAPAKSVMNDSLAIKVALLKKQLEQMPDKKIPELQFVTERDWANAARDADLDTEDGVRQALSKLREEAENTFLNDLTKAAIKEYLAANGGVLPSDLYQLKPYFDVPVTDEMLQRYELLQTGKPDPSVPLVKEIAPPVDDEYDSYHEISINGAGGSGVNKIASSVLAAMNAFARNNPGQRPTTPSQITPYLKQPIDTVRIQKYLNKFTPPNQ
jgi:RNA polymerase sigma factor (sigma-70 family)